MREALKGLQWQPNAAMRRGSSRQTRQGKLEGSPGRTDIDDASRAHAKHAESLSPPPPRANQRKEVDLDASYRKLPRYHVENQPPLNPRMSPSRSLLTSAAGGEAIVVSAAEAVASALSLAPSIRRRVEAEVSSAARTESDALDVRSEPVSLGLDERWAGNGFLDLTTMQTIPESPSEAVPERTPEARLGVGSIDRLDSPGRCDFALSMDQSVSLSTSAPSTQMAPSPVASSSPSGTPGSRVRRLSKQGMAVPEVGKPVSFYLDGRADPYLGTLKAIAPNGLYTVDLVGGGRMVGLEHVTPCTHWELSKAARGKRPVVTSEDDYAVFNIRNKDSGGTDWSALSTIRFAIGDAVSFRLEKHEKSHSIAVAYPEQLYGRVQKVCDDGSYVLDLPGGGRRTGVRYLTPAIDEDLSKMRRLQQGLITRKDSFTTENTRNSPAWGGGCGWSSGYRERSPPARGRSLSRSASIPSMPPPASASDLAGRRSLSPQLVRRSSTNSKPGRKEVQEPLEKGSAVTFFTEGQLQASFGTILCIDDGGRYTVDVAGGRRVVGLKEVAPCSRIELEIAGKSKRGMTTRKDMNEGLSSPYRPPSRSPSPVPHLRGVAINFPPRSATRLSLA